MRGDSGVADEERVVGIPSWDAVTLLDIIEE